MRCLLLGLFFSVAALHGLAQGSGGIVRGVLYDSSGKLPLTEATVSVINQKDSALISFTLTSKGGSFEIKNIPWGAYQLISSSVGLQTKSDTFFSQHLVRALQTSALFIFLPSTKLLTKW